MKIVTGHKGEEHITSSDVQGLLGGMSGNMDGVLYIGNTFQSWVSTSDNRTLWIRDGEGIMQGVHFRLNPGQYDTLLLDAGLAGVNRNDLICARYTKDAGTGVEAVNWQVIKGEETSGTAVDPEYVEGDIRDGALIADYPMFRVRFTSSSAAPTVETLFKYLPPVWNYYFRSNTNYAGEEYRSVFSWTTPVVPRGATGWECIIMASVSYQETAQRSASLYTGDSSSPVVVMDNQGATNVLYFNSHILVGGNKNVGIITNSIQHTPVSTIFRAWYRPIIVGDGGIVL